MFASFDRGWLRHDRVSLTLAIACLLVAAYGYPAWTRFGWVIAVTAR
jgi:hypothetical protein